MNYLIIDTETQGLLEDKYASFDDPESWPPIRQIAWQVFQSNGELTKEENIFINNSNSSIEITLKKLLNDIKEFNPILVGHNIDFDKNVIGAELIRKKLPNKLIHQKYVCTMEQTVEFCSLPNSKFPKLQELHIKLFSCEFEGAT